MADYTKQTWTDDDGSGTTGTAVTKSRMDHIEDGIANAANKEWWIKPVDLMVSESAPTSGDYVVGNPPVQGVALVAGLRILFPAYGIYEVQASGNPAAVDTSAINGATVVVKDGIAGRKGRAWYKNILGSPVFLPSYIDAATISSTGMGVVVHGSTAGTARPTDFKQIIWIGSVQPTNADADDIWIDTSTASILADSGMGVVVHGAVSSVARPTGWKQVYWIGSVEPSNMAADDIWHDTSGYTANNIVPVVSALPGSPVVDGTEVDLVVDATAGVIWRMRYRDATTRWHFVGGPQLIGEAGSGTFAGDGTWKDPGTQAGPTLTVPFAGDYDIEWWGKSSMGLGAGTQNVNSGVSVNGASPASPLMAENYHAVGNNYQTDGRRVRKVTLAAATTLKIRFMAATSTCFVGESYQLMLTPIRSAVV